MKIAAEIQRSLISTKLPHVPFTAIATRFDPYRKIAGDFYYVVANKNEICVVVADVAGKGVSAALLTHTLQGMENAGLDYYGTARLEAAFSASKDLNDVVADFDRFRDNEPANDDRTMVEIHYH